MTNDGLPKQLLENIMDLRSCVEVIETMVHAYGKSDENRDRMDRIIRHIESMCAMPHVAESGVDISPYHRAIDLGRSWLTQD